MAKKQRKSAKKKAHPKRPVLMGGGVDMLLQKYILFLDCVCIY